MPNVVIIIPARYASTRFPGKPLADLWGKPIIQHVWERAGQARAASRVIVATDDERIAAAARGFGAPARPGEVFMTRPDHPSGTDRVAEVAAQIEADIVVNVQGDEPLIDPAAIDAAVAPLFADPAIPMGTLCCPIEDVEDLANPNVVKVVCDREGFALYFSRLPIPFVRDKGADARRAALHTAGGQAGGQAQRFRHIGLYVYRRDFLLRFARLAPTLLEQAERLEQLRALEHGFRIRVVQVQHTSPGVDTPGELERLRASQPRGGNA